MMLRFCRVCACKPVAFLAIMAVFNKFERLKQVSRCKYKHFCLLNQHFRLFFTKYFVV